ncbi:fimbria/pilus outer membrane usher protein [Cupriavidus plantarum]|uniref:fimbria/pilus outer membrane usher protein n=2 Tax=Cupriavidus plantarum TaxID=942865 RepID=UPI00339D3F51
MRAARPARAAAMALALVAATAPAPTGAARNEATMLAAVEFDMGFLRGDGPPIDGARFAYGNPVQPGVHPLALHLNGRRIGRADIRLDHVNGYGALPQPCIDRALLTRLGVDTARLTREATAALTGPAETCHPIDSLIEGATAHVDMSDFRMDIGVPQVALATRARGSIDPDEWDDGVTAAMLRYDASVYGTRYSQASAGTSMQAYAGLRGGINLGPWRLRHDGNLSAASRDGGDGRTTYRTTYRAMQTSLQRAIAPLDSQLTVGDGFTDGTLFDSVGFRGIRLASDDRMLPESRRGFAPAVRGMANTNARVQIRQHGTLLYETTVAPGAFEIGDLYPTGYGGDLDVSVTEADGSVRAWRVPFTATVQALRPGVTRMALTVGQHRVGQHRVGQRRAGQYRANQGRQPSSDATPWLAQATVRHGLTNLVTLEGGIAASRDYAALAAGVALNTAYGAFAADITQTFAASADGTTHRGQRLRVAYQRTFPLTGTSVSLSGYRLAGDGYLSLADAIALRHAPSPDMAMTMQPIGRVQAIVNQPIGTQHGTFYLSGSMQTFRHRDGRHGQFQIGYSHRLGRVHYSLSAARLLDMDAGRWDTRVMLTLGVPLGDGTHRPYAGSALTYDPRGHLTAQQSLTGTAGRDNTLAYGVTATASRIANAGGPREAYGASANAAYVGTLAAINGNAGVASGYRQAGGGISGMIVGYAGGLALSPAQGDTLAVVEADDAPGARIASASGMRVGPWGRAVVSNLQPFSRNAIEIDPRGLPLSVELKTDTHHVAPTAGAVVRARFDAHRSGRPALIRARMADGLPMSFGAEIFAADGRALGTVAQGGRALVRGLMEDAGALTVTWGAGPHEQCVLDYVLAGGSSDLPAGEGTCRR